MSTPLLEKKKPSRWNLLKKHWKKGRETLDEEQRDEKQQSSPNRSDATASSSDVASSILKDIVAKNKSKWSVKTSSKSREKNASSFLEGKPQRDPLKFAAAPDSHDLPKDTPALKRAADTTSPFAPTTTTPSASAVTPKAEAETSYSKKAPKKKVTAVKAKETNEQVEQTHASNQHEASESSKAYLKEFDPFGPVIEDETPPHFNEEQWDSFMCQFPSDADVIKPDRSTTYSTRKEAHVNKIVAASSALKPATKKAFSTEPEVDTKAAATKSNSSGTKPAMVTTHISSSKSFSKASSFCSLTWNEWDDEKSSAPKEVSKVLQELAQVSAEQKSITNAANDKASKASGMNSSKAGVSPRSLKQIASDRIAKEAKPARELQVLVESKSPRAISAEESKGAESTVSVTPSASEQNASSPYGSSIDSQANAFPEDPMVNYSVAKLKKRTVAAKEAEPARELQASIGRNSPRAISEESKVAESTVSVTPSESLQNASSPYDSSTYSQANAFLEDPMVNYSVTKLKKRTIAAKEVEPARKLRVSVDSNSPWAISAGESTVTHSEPEHNASSSYDSSTYSPENAFPEDPVVNYSVVKLKKSIVAAKEAEPVKELQASVEIKSSQTILAEESKGAESTVSVTHSESEHNASSSYDSSTYSQENSLPDKPVVNYSAAKLNHRTVPAQEAEPAKELRVSVVSNSPRAISEEESKGAESTVSVTLLESEHNANSSYDSSFDYPDNSCPEDLMVDLRLRRHSAAMLKKTAVAAKDVEQFQMPAENKSLQAISAKESKCLKSTVSVKLSDSKRNGSISNNCCTDFTESAIPERPMINRASRSRRYALAKLKKRAIAAKEVEQVKLLGVSVESNTPRTISGEESKGVESTVPVTPSESIEKATSSYDSCSDSRENSLPDKPVVNYSVAKLKKSTVAAKEAEPAKELRMSVESKSPRAISAEKRKGAESTVSVTPSESEHDASSSYEFSACSQENAFPEESVVNLALGPRRDAAAKVKKRAVAAAVAHQLAARREDSPFDENGYFLEMSAGGSTVCFATGPGRNAAMQTTSNSTWRAHGSISEQSQPVTLVEKASSFELNRSHRMKGKRRSFSVDIPQNGTRHLSPLAVQHSKAVSNDKKQTASTETDPEMTRHKCHVVDKNESLERKSADKNEWKRHYQSDSLTTRWTGAKISETELARPRWTFQNKLVPLEVTPSPLELTDFVMVETSQEGVVEMTISEEVKTDPIKVEAFCNHTSENASTVSCTDVTSDDGSWTDSSTVDNEFTNMTNVSTSYITNESRSRICITTEYSRSHISVDSRSQASYDSKSYFTDDSESDVTDESRSHCTDESRSYESRSYITNDSSSYVANESRSYWTNDSRSYWTNGSRSTNVTDDYISDEDESSYGESDNEEEPQYLWEQIAETLIVGKPWQG